MAKSHTDSRTVEQVDFAYRDEAGTFTNRQDVTETTHEMLRTGHRIFEVCEQSGFC